MRCPLCGEAWRYVLGDLQSSYIGLCDGFWHIVGLRIERLTA